MDTRKLTIKQFENELAIIDLDNHDVIGIIQLTGDEAFDEANRQGLANDLIKRFNRYPLLTAFIQQVADKITDNDEAIDFITNNSEVVLEDKDGNDVDEFVDYFNNPDLFNWQQD